MRFYIQEGYEEILFNVLESVISGFSCTNLYNVLDVVYEDLTIADLAGVKSLLSGFYNGFNRNLANHDLDLYLGQQVSFDLNAAVELSGALLHAAAEYVGDCHTGYANVGHSRLEYLELILLAEDNDLAHLCAVRRLGVLVSNGNRSLNRSRTEFNGFNFLLLAGGGEFNMHCGNEVRIRGGESVLCSVQTDDLFVTGYSQTDSLLDDEECERDGDSGPCKYCYHAEELYAELCESAAVEKTYSVLAGAVDSSHAAVLTVAVGEKTYCDSTPDTVEEMYCNCADRVVDVQFVVEEPYAEANQ